MLSLARGFFITCLIFILGQAHASILQVERWYFEGMPSTQNYPTQQGACQAGLDQLGKSQNWKTYVFKRYDAGHCRADIDTGSGFSSDFPYGRIFTAGMGCPANSTATGGSCSCNSGFHEEAGLCVEALTSEAACGVAFYNSGAWQNTSLPVTLEGQLSSGSYCQPQGDDIKPGLACAMDFQQEVGWKSDDGKWHTRGFLKPKMIGTGFVPCVPGLDEDHGGPQPGETPKLPDKKDPTCPNGYKGTVGGQEACIPSYGYNGVDFAPKTKTSETATTKTETTTKTECSSGKCKTTVTETVTDKATGQQTTSSNTTEEVDRDWCAKAENKDSCAANGKPSYSGQGTGVSAGGGKGDGEEGGSCGVEGKPPCKVKVDETGVQSKFEGDTSSLDEWKTTMEGNRDQIKGSGDGIFDGLNMFWSAPPLASCVPLQLPKDMGQITQQCDVVNGVRDAMFYIWALTGLWFCVGWVKESI